MPELRATIYVLRTDRRDPLYGRIKKDGKRSLMNETRSSAVCSGPAKSGRSRLRNSRRSSTKSKRTFRIRPTAKFPQARSARSIMRRLKGPRQGRICPICLGLSRVCRRRRIHVELKDLVQPASIGRKRKKNNRRLAGSPRRASGLSASSGHLRISYFLPLSI